MTYQAPEIIEIGKAEDTIQGPLLQGLEPDPDMVTFWQ